MTLGEGEGRPERPDRDDDVLALALRGSLKGRPGGRLGLELDRADFEILGGMLPVRVTGV
jgi:hypothetical protein